MMNHHAISVASMFSAVDGIRQSKCYQPFRILYDYYNKFPYFDELSRIGAKTMLSVRAKSDDNKYLNRKIQRALCVLVGFCPKISSYQDNKVFILSIYE